MHWSKVGLLIGRKIVFSSVARCNADAQSRTARLSLKCVRQCRSFMRKISEEKVGRYSGRGPLHEIDEGKKTGERKKERERDLGRCNSTAMANGEREKKKKSSL